MDSHTASDETSLASSLQPSPLTWIGSDRRLARRIGRPMLRFSQFHAGGGIVLLAATAVALIWANSPWRDSYHALLESHTRIEFGSLLVLDEQLEDWINDALMVVFFFVVGLEIKRELVVGELRRPSAAALPAVAAVGGMVLPATIYALFNAGGDGSSGWGIPMATDIAFAVGVVALLGRSVPSSLKIFLLTLAIVDDIGSIAVIAIFYTSDISLAWLAAAGSIVLLLVMMRLARLWYTPLYLVVGVTFWLALFKSGIHATIAGVVMGMFAPARPLMSRTRFSPLLQRFISEGSLSVATARRALFEVRERVSVVDRISDVLRPWISLLIIPVFALANAGVELSSGALEDALRSPVTIGIALGLVIGKLAGVVSFTWLAVRLGFCELPAGATWPKVVGIGAVAGIGFTVSLFITNLAFESSEIADEAKIGILIASAVAAVGGAAILRSSKDAMSRSAPAGVPESVAESVDRGTPSSSPGSVAIDATDPLAPLETSPITSESTAEESPTS
ncbi:MAG: Na+/H+ antiporter NhaA [Acidimicrobiaceae bacterium]|nr:Na+/H+ antiporter NhaA [Acidimicrobiaceae bacterium]